MKEIPDETAFVGEKWVEDSGEPARTVSVRRIVYDANGKLMYDTTWSSSYVAEPKIVHVGTKPLPEPVEEAPTETEPPATTEDGTARNADEPTPSSRVGRASALEAGKRLRQPTRQADRA